MTLSIIHGQLADATLRSIALDTADRWYLDTICRRNLTHTTPKVGGSFALTGADVTIYLISTGVCDSPCFYGRLSWLLGDVGVDVVGTGTNMAFLLGASHYGVAPRCIIKSLNVYTAKGILAAAPNTRDHLVAINELTGNGILEYHVESIPLNVGRYIVTIACWDETGGVALDHHEKLYDFIVEDALGKDNIHERFGLVHIPAEWKLS